MDYKDKLELTINLDEYDNPWVSVENVNQSDVFLVAKGLLDIMYGAVKKYKWENKTDGR